MTVYVSTSCLKSDDDMSVVIETYCKNGINNVELGPSLKSVGEIDKIKRFGLNFIVHHYFPPPPKPFIVNLASQNAEILQLSRKQIKKSINFCCESGIKLFTLHAGFRTDPDLNFKFSKDQPINSYNKAFNTFVESVHEINDYALMKGIKLAIENNVLSEHNVIEGKNELLLLCEAIEYENLWEKVRSDNLGILLDVGHLNVTAHWLKFDKYDFIERVKKKIFAFHIHDNNGKSDTHSRINRSSWFIEAISKYNFVDIPVVLEMTNLTIEQIIQDIKIIENVINNSQIKKGP